MSDLATEAQRFLLRSEELEIEPTGRLFTDREVEGFERDASPGDVDQAAWLPGRRLLEPVPTSPIDGPTR
jgi:hypothetical protein